MMLSKLRRRFVRWIGRRAARHPRLIPWYFLLTGEFTWEQRAVFLGLRSHQQDAPEGAGEAARSQLRRCVHRLEKGLIMRPRRGIFAEEYIGETVGLYRAIQTTARAGDDPLLGWAGDVLDDFFEVVGSSPRLEAAKHDYLAARPTNGRQTALVNGCLRAAPFVPDRHPLGVSIAEMQALAHRRRSVRWYQNRPVPREMIDQALEVARWSPSACNRQPFEFRVFDDPQLVRKVSKIPMGTKGFAQNFPCIVVLVGKLDAFEFARDRHLIYIDAALAAMAFEFGLEVQGLGSCSINWPEIPERERALVEAIGLGPHERPVMLISLGFPEAAAPVPYSQKKPMSEFRSYNMIGRGTC